MKKIFFILAITSLALAVPLAAGSATAFTRGAEQDYSSLPPEKARFIDNTLKEQASLSRPLHRELRQKFQELEYVSRLQKAEVKDITRILDEIKNLQNRLDDLRQAANDKILKETGIDYRPGPGFKGENCGRWNNSGNRGHGWAGGNRHYEGRSQGWKHGFGHERGWGRHQWDF
jgi:hypothetical protein